MVRGEKNPRPLVVLDRNQLLLNHAATDGGDGATKYGGGLSKGDVAFKASDPGGCIRFGQFGYRQVRQKTRVYVLTHDRCLPGK
ncbi:hypothetical protein WCLP8_3380003 [uncultured Gammaproteobacteria bacterium]